MFRQRNSFFFLLLLKGGVVSLWGLVCGCCVLYSVKPLSAQAVLFSPVLERNVPVLTAYEHPWARYLPKSWSRTQTVTTTELEDRRVRNITETKTILESVDGESLTLKSISTVDIGGRSVETSHQRKTVDFYSELVVEGTKIDQHPSTTLTIGKQLIPCEVRSYILLSPETKQRTTVWYSTQIYPYVLRVERILTAFPTEKDREEKILSSSTTELLDTDAIYLRRSKQGNYRYRTITKTGDITTDATMTGSRRITGGLDHEIVREMDQNGKVIRTMETRMINYFALDWASQRRN